MKSHVKLAKQGKNDFYVLMIDMFRHELHAASYPRTYLRVTYLEELARRLELTCSNMRVITSGIRYQVFSFLLLT